MNPRHRFIQCYSLGGRVGVLVELGHEKLATAAQDSFLAVSYRIAKIIADRNPTSTRALLRQPFQEDPDITVERALAAVPTLVGERVTITRFVRWYTEPGPELDPAVAMSQRRA